MASVTTLSTEGLVWVIVNIISGTRYYPGVFPFLNTLDRHRNFENSVGGGQGSTILAPL